MMKKTYLLVFGLLCQIGFAQRGLYVLDGTGVHAPAVEKRYALLIGNAAYQRVGRLNNPLNDVEDMMHVLQSLGFEVDTIQNGALSRMNQAITRLGRKAQGVNSVALFYYSGHGLQVSNDNWLVPVDAEAYSPAEVQTMCVSLKLLMDVLEQAHSGTNIVILDACRNNPFSYSKNGGGGLAYPSSAPSGTYIAFSTAPFTMAADGRGRNSPYTAALKKILPIPNLKIEETFKLIRQEVALSKQISWENSSLMGDFYFKTVSAAANERDSDGDGTPDAQDKCPNQFGEPEDGGCPNYTENELIAIAKIEEAKRTGADSLSLQKLDLKRLPSAVKHLTDLKKVDLSENEISNIAVLKELKQLNTLYWSENKISDISILRELKQLKTLDLFANKISNIAVLRDLKQLTVLDLSHNQLIDISALRELKQLTELSLKRNEISDISALRELKKLTGLGLKSNKISDISALQELKQLTELDLYNNQIRNVSALRELKQLTVLSLNDNKIQNFNLDLNLLPHLNELYLDDNPIQNIPKEIINFRNCVDEIRAYQKMSMQERESKINKIVRLRIQNYENGKLDLSGLVLTAIPDAIKKLSDLKTLDLRGNQIQDISALRELKQLTTLDLCSNQIRDVSALRELKQLTILNLCLNQIIDVSALQELKQLTELDLNDNKIQNFNLDLNLLSHLNELYLDGNPIQNIPKEIIGSEFNNCTHELRAYQKQQRK